MARQATPTHSETSLSAAATSRLGWRAEGEHPSASSTRSMNQLTVTTSNGRSLTVYDAGDPDGRPIEHSLVVPQTEASDADGDHDAGESDGRSEENEA